MSASTTKPIALTVVPENIPAKLRALDRWVVWRWTWKGGKWTKPPYSATTGKLASSTDLKTWTSFTVALEAYRQSKGTWDGIGLALIAGDDLTGVDLDHCVTATGIDPEALQDVRALNS